MFNEYCAWLQRVNVLLLSSYNIHPEHVWQGDWHFDWHRSWVAGVTPWEAIQDAVAELRDRGILEEVLESVSEYDTEHY